MGNQQTAIKDQDHLDQKTANNTSKVHPEKFTTPQQKSLLTNSQQQKMKRPLSSFELSMSANSQVSRLKAKRKNSTDNTQINIEKFEEEGLLSLEQIDNIYFYSDSNIVSFFDNLQEPLSKLYMALAKHAMALMNSKFSQTDREAKLFLCQKMLNTNLNIMKTLGQKKKHQFDENVFKKFNQLQRSIISYLKAKYPKGQQNFVPGDLMNAFKSFDYIQSPENDILIQSGFYFGQSNDRDLMKKVKEFLNNLIDQVDLNFPRFQRILQQRVFKTSKSSEKSLAYKINRRLPENITKFISINSNSLDIISPELFRVVLKWIDDMQQFILNPDEEVDSKETLKVINEEDDSKYFTDQINTEDNYFVIKELKQKLHDEKENYQHELSHLIQNMYKFQHNLIKIIEQAELSERYVPRKDAQIIKFAAYNTKFMSWMLAQKLTIAMKILINVGRHFKNTMMMMPLDLIKFNVTDILRATLKGSKSQLLQVYGNFKKLESEDEIKIIRLQNQLGTALNGIIINFKMKNCFIIYEVSLILSESSHSESQKIKSIEKLNNFFSDLEASPYGVLSELSSYVGYKDSKIGYENKVNFVSKEFGISICEIRHPMKIETIKEQYEPFVCTSCSRFYGRLENIFVMKKCAQCNNFLCCKCIFVKNTSLETNCLKEQILKYLNDQVSYSVEVTRGKSQGTVQGMTGNLIYEKSFEKIVYMKDIQKERKLKKMNRTQFQVYIDSLKIKNFIYGTYEKGEITLISLNYNQNLKQLSFGLYKNQDFYSSKRLGYNSSDFLLIFDTQIAFTDIQSVMLQKIPFINIFSKDRKIQKGKYEIYKINEINILLGFKGQKKEQKLVIDGVEVIGEGQIGQLSKKDFKFGTLKSYLEFSGIVETGRGSIKLQQLGIQKSHLLQLISLPWTSKITELNISKNKITQVNEILKHLPNLERFSATQNYIKQITFQIKLPRLSNLIMKRNLLKTIKNTQNIPKIEKMNFEQNRFETFPILNLKQLRHLNLESNYYLTNLDFLSKSTLPQLIYINLQNSLQNIQYIDNDDGSDSSINIPFKQLKCLIAVKLIVRILNLSSQNVERLNLTFSTIKHINAKLNNLQYIYAEYCKIQNIQFLFNHTNQNHVIKEIDLSFNAIASIPTSIKSKSLQKLSLKGNLLTDITSLANSQLPSLKSLDISHNQITILPKLSFENLTQLILYGNPFYDIDQFAKSSLSFIESLEFSPDNPIKSWPKFQMPNLKVFNLPSVQQSASLEQFQTSQLPKIQNLQFQSVNLKKFPLINFYSLECLRLYYCTIQGMEFLSQCKLPNLKKIQLSSINSQDQEQDQQKKKQRLKKFKIDLPNHLDKLSQINVSSCEFFNIENLISKPFKNIITITIQYSNLSTVPKMNLPSLKFIYFNSNKINDISNFCESQIPLIQEIDISINQITTLKKLNFKNLMSFNISSNKLQNIGSIELPNLNKIDISYNNLTQFPIIWAQKLNEMIFDRNPFKNLKNLQKCHIPNLKNITFSEIQLEENSKICPKLNFPTIQTLTLYNMNFTQIDKINGLIKLQSLSISYCSKITQFPCLNLPQLKTLYVSNSQFGSWKKLWQSKIQNLVNLQINWSNIESLKGIKLPNLEDLSIQQNEKLTSVEEFFSFNKFIHLKSILFLGNRNLVINHQINLHSLKKFQVTFSSMTSTKLIGSNDQLTELRICQSNLTQFNLKEFRKLQNVEIMTCQIKNIDEFCQKQWRYMKILSLTQNKITQLPKMTQFPSLQMVNFDNNGLENVKQFMQNSMLLSLISLSLNYNKIKQINQIKNFPKLNVLYLDYNEIESLGFMSKLQNINPLISTVAINNNKIKKDIPAIKIGVESLQLKNNMIQSIEWLQNSQLPRLQYLDISNNKIKQLISLSKFNKLNTITLSSNPIQQYDQFLFKQKLPTSFSYITFNTTKEQTLIDKDCQKFSSLYQNVSLSINPFQQTQQENLT